MSGIAGDLDGRVALVTGGGSGIGAAICRRLSAAGAALVVADVDSHAASEVADEIQRDRGTAIAFACDSSDPVQSAAAVTFAVEKFGALHVSVNNAGIGGPLGPTGAIDIDGWDKVIAVNLSAVFYGMHFDIPRSSPRAVDPSSICLRYWVWWAIRTSYRTRRQNTGSPA